MERRSPASTFPATPWTPIGIRFGPRGGPHRLGAGGLRPGGGPHPVPGTASASSLAGGGDLHGQDQDHQEQSLMAYVSLEDDTASMELLVFSRVLEESGGYLQATCPSWPAAGSPSGTRKPPSSCVTGSPLSQVPEPAGAAAPSPEALSALWRATIPLLTRVRNLFVLFPGQQTAVLYLADSKQPAGGGACSTRPAPGAEKSCWGRKMWCSNDPPPLSIRKAYHPYETSPAKSSQRLFPRRRRMFLIAAGIAHYSLPSMWCCWSSFPSISSTSTGSACWSAW